jgi:hypothetical protein
MTNEFIKLLKPQNIFANKRRLGPNEDGGYVLPEFVFKDSVALFTYGVGHDSRFEEEYSTTYKKPSYLFDHTIRTVEPWRLKEQKEEWKRTEEYWLSKDCYYFQHGLGFQDNCKDFYDDYKMLDTKGYVILKIDIECGEYEYFLKTDVSKMESTVMAISLEVHWINDETNNENLVKILKKINEYFVLCHVHGNSWGEYWEFDGQTLPVTLELSFVNRKFVDKYEPDNQKYPIVGLDVSNNPSKPDCNLDFLNTEKTNDVKETKDIKETNNPSYKELFSKFYDTYGFGGFESRSGGGSTLAVTTNICKNIVDLVHEKGIKSVIDIPCGDFNWMKEIVFRFDTYLGGDIVPQCIKDNNERYSNSRIKFVEFDIVTDTIPDGDLLIVRDVIGHFPLEEGRKIVSNILKSNCKYLLSTTWYNINDKDYYKKHINENVNYGRWYSLNLMSKPFNFPEPEMIIEEDTIVTDYENGVRKVLGLWDIEKIKNNVIIEERPDMINKDLTVVTGLWNIGRIGRDFTHYITEFKKFLEIPINMFIYIPKEYEYLVWETRSRENTFVKIAELDYIKNLYSPFWDKTQVIRNDANWYNSTGENGWLKNSPQATLEYYNPIVQSKMFMVNDVSIWNPFNTEYFIWLDAGITNSVYEKFFTENRALDNIIPYLNDFLFLSYPYEAVDEIHGFNFKAINNYAGDTVKYVCRGGLFGGKKDAINQASATYYSTLQKTLDDGYMGTEESVFAIMAYREPQIYRRYSLDGNGLIVKFIDDLIKKNVELVPIPETKYKSLIHISDYDLSRIKTNVYILTFNFPEQLQYTINSMEKVSEWLTKPHLVLLDNSTDESAVIGNKSIAEKYNFEYIKMDRNTGICGGRQRAAEHFHESDADFYLFFEDDMTVNPPELAGQFCRNGFRKYIPNLYNIIHKIMMKEDFDFLKLSFTEVYFDNDKALPWYNTPQHIRTRDWPDYDQLPITGLDPNSPSAKYDYIKVSDGVAYVIGEVNYCNWPMIVSKEGNKKMFIDTKWSSPFEQTWSSHIYQLEKEGKINAGLLLSSPIWHERIKYYQPEERREN